MGMEHRKKSHTDISEKTLRKWLAEMFPQQENIDALLNKWLQILPYHIVAILISKLHDHYIMNPSTWNKSPEYLSAIIYEHYRIYVEAGSTDTKGHPLGRPEPYWWKKFRLRQL